MDLPLIGTLILGAIWLPYVVEVLFQVRLLALLLAALPEAARAGLPRHPRRRSLGFLGSAAFFVAVWRTFRRDLPGDLPAVVIVKRRMRVSLWREITWAACFATALAILLAIGWRPIWP